MTTRRLIDETHDSLALRLLESARLDTPPRGSMARTAAAIGISSAALAGTLSLGASGVATTSSKGLLWVLLKGVMLGGAAGAVVIGGGTWISEQVRTPPADEVVASGSDAPAPVVAAAKYQEPSAIQAEPAPEVKVRVVPVEPTLPEAAPSVTEAVAAFDGRDGAAHLAAEVAAIDRTRSLLRSGRAAAALAELERYEVATPTRELGIEAAVLRVEALVGAGRRAEAAELARHLLRAPSVGIRRAYLERVAAEGPQPP